MLAPCAWLTDNAVLGSLIPQARSRLVFKWRKGMVDCCRAGNLPCGDDRLEYIRVRATARFAGRPPVRDGNAGALHHTLKAVIDGLTPEKRRKVKGVVKISPGWGLIKDDDDRHIESSSIVIGEPLPVTVDQDHPGFLIVQITELPRPGALF
jgi:hypothetical protein